MFKTEELTDFVAKTLFLKKGNDILLLDLRRISPIADYFIIVSANSVVHAQSLSQEVEQKVKEKYGLSPHHTEGYNPAHWILIDFLRIVVHIFLPEVRDFYGLERLWGDVPQRKFDKCDVE